MKNIVEMLNAYQEANKATRASMARSIGIEERGLRGIMTEGRNITPEEEAKIRAWLISEQFDYIPPVKADSKAEPVTKHKVPNKGKKANESGAIGIRGDAKVLVQFYREAKGFKTDTDAATALVKKGFKAVIAEVE